MNKDFTLNGSVFGPLIYFYCNRNKPPSSLWLYFGRLNHLYTSHLKSCFLFIQVISPVEEALSCDCCNRTRGQTNRLLPRRQIHQLIDSPEPLQDTHIHHLFKSQLTFLLCISLSPVLLAIKKEKHSVRDQQLTIQSVQR